MAYTTSLAFPNMLDVSSNTVNVAEDAASVVNRVRLLMLTESTELYKEPDQGVGLRKHLWQYNTENQKAIIKDKIVEQLRLYEPCVISDNTQFADGLLFTGSNDITSIEQEYNKLKMTVSLDLSFGDTAEIYLNDLIQTDEVMANGR